MQTETETKIQANKNSDQNPDMAIFQLKKKIISDQQSLKQNQEQLQNILEQTNKVDINDDLYYHPDDIQGKQEEINRQIIKRISMLQETLNELVVEKVQLKSIVANHFNYIQTCSDLIQKQYGMLTSIAEFFDMGEIDFKQDLKKIENVIQEMETYRLFYQNKTNQTTSEDTTNNLNNQLESMTRNQRIVPLVNINLLKNLSKHESELYSAIEQGSVINKMKDQVGRQQYILENLESWKEEQKNLTNNLSNEIKGKVFKTDFQSLQKDIKDHKSEIQQKFQHINENFTQKYLTDGLLDQIQAQKELMQKFVTADFHQKDLSEHLEIQKAQLLNIVKSSYCNLEKINACEKRILNNDDDNKLLHKNLSKLKNEYQTDIQQLIISTGEQQLSFQNYLTIFLEDTKKQFITQNQLDQFYGSILPNMDVLNQKMENSTEQVNKFNDLLNQFDENLQQKASKMDIKIQQKSMQNEIEKISKKNEENLEISKHETQNYLQNHGLTIKKTILLELEAKNYKQVAHIVQEKLEQYKFNLVSQQLVELQEEIQRKADHVDLVKVIDSKSSKLSSELMIRYLDNLCQETIKLANNSTNFLKKFCDEVIDDIFTEGANQSQNYKVLKKKQQFKLFQQDLDQIIVNLQAQNILKSQIDEQMLKTRYEKNPKQKKQHPYQNDNNFQHLPTIPYQNIQNNSANLNDHESSILSSQSNIHNNIERLQYKNNFKNNNNQIDSNDQYVSSKQKHSKNNNNNNINFNQISKTEDYKNQNVEINQQSKKSNNSQSNNNINDSFSQFLEPQRSIIKELQKQSSPNPMNRYPRMNQSYDRSVTPNGLESKSQIIPKQQQFQDFTLKNLIQHKDSITKSIDKGGLTKAKNNNHHNDQNILFIDILNQKKDLK